MWLNNAESSAEKTMVERVIFFLVMLEMGAGNVVYRDATSSRSGPSQASFNITELRCFAQEKVLHHDGNCYSLRQKGPCQEGEWLVYDKDALNGSNRRRLVCRTVPCRALRVFWSQDGQCHKKTEQATLCPYQGNELRSDVFGEGECACEKTYIRYKQEVVKGGKIVWDGACYPLYQRGPCPARKILVAESLQGFGPVGECKDDSCHRENSLAPSGTWYAPLHGACHQLGQRGVCEENTTLTVNHLTNLPECLGNSVSLLSLFNNTERCDGNINKLTDECREVLVLKGGKFGEEINRPRRPRSRSS